jgi:hypothetical protein
MWMGLSPYLLMTRRVFMGGLRMHVSGGFSGGLLPFLPVIRQKRRQLVLAVRTIRTLWKISFVMANGC